MYAPIPYASQLWSVGIEEQFYLIWPLIVKFFKRKFLILYLIIIGYIFMNIYGFNFIKYHFINNEIINYISEVWSNFSIDCMAIGGLFAMYLHLKFAWIAILFNKYILAEAKSKVEKENDF